MQKTEVPLRCGDELEGTEIHWRCNGQQIPATGNNIEVTIDAMLGGNFTCHSASGDVLNHTLVLVKPVDFEKVILNRTHNGGKGKRTAGQPVPTDIRAVEKDQTVQTSQN